MKKDEMKQEILKRYLEDQNLINNASSEEKAEYKELIEEGCKKNWIVALELKAYACYGGNCVYECDWEASRDCLLKIIELQEDENPFIYNTLGYIYYYGRCNGNVPEYDKALQYFMVGAANGVFESRYKLADMMLLGKGVPRSYNAAVSIVCELYDETFESFCNNEIDGKFADVALRLGGLYERGEGSEGSNYEAALFYYMQAAYAINLRMMYNSFYGDEKVRTSINEALGRVKKYMADDYYKSELSLETPVVMGSMLSSCQGLEVELHSEDDKYYIKATRVCGEQSQKNFLLTVPEINICEFVNAVTFRIDGITDIGIEAFQYGPQKAFITDIEFDSEHNCWVFTCSNKAMLTIGCEAFVLDSKGL